MREPDPNAQELAEDAIRVCICAQAMLFSTIYRTETSRCWAVTKEILTLTHKIDVMLIKFRPDELLRKKLWAANRTLKFAYGHAQDAYSRIYHKDKLGYYQREQQSLAACDLKLKEVKSILLSITKL